MSAKLLKKLGTKQIIGDVLKVSKSIENDGDTILLYSLYGESDGVKTGPGTFDNPWTAFQGNMEAVNQLTGEVFSSTQCFVPEPLNTMLLGALKENDKIEFAFSVHLKRRDDLPTNYEYIVEPKQEPQSNDRLAKMRELIQLPAPKSKK